MCIYVCIINISEHIWCVSFFHRRLATTISSLVLIRTGLTWLAWCNCSRTWVVGIPELSEYHCQRSIEFLRVHQINSKCVQSLSNLWLIGVEFRKIPNPLANIHSLLKCILPCNLKMMLWKGFFQGSMIRSGSMFFLKVGRGNHMQTFSHIPHKNHLFLESFLKDIKAPVSSKRQGAPSNYTTTMGQAALVNRTSERCRSKQGDGMRLAFLHRKNIVKCIYCKNICSMQYVYLCMYMWIYVCIYVYIFVCLDLDTCMIIWYYDIICMYWCSHR